LRSCEFQYQRSDLNLLAAYRKIPILDAPPAKVTLTEFVYIFGELAMNGLQSGVAGLAAVLGSVRCQGTYIQTWPIQSAEERKIMARKAQKKLVVPFGLDARLIRSRYAGMLPGRKKAFGAEFERFSQLQQLRIDAAARSARIQGLKLRPLERQDVALAKRTVATLKRLRPDIPRHFPPDGPSPVLMGPPYNASVPVQFSSSGEVDFRAWDAGPKAATGQVGGALNTWSGGVGMAKSQVGLFLQVPKPPVSASGLPTYEVVVQATLIGNYYLAAPPGGYAAASADLTLDFLDEVPEPSFDQPQLVGLISEALLPPFTPTTAWDYLNNLNLELSPKPPTPYSFQQLFKVNMGDAPGPVQINVGVTQKVSGSPGAIAGIDIEMTVLSIGFAFLS
jgi:hypothetical protein